MCTLIVALTYSPNGAWGQRYARGAAAATGGHHSRVGLSKMNRFLTSDIQQVSAKFDLRQLSWFRNLRHLFIRSNSSKQKFTTETGNTYNGTRNSEMV